MAERCYQLVKRYGVDRRLVTHWEVAKETDYGEVSGGPQYIPTAKEYHEYYKITIKPILEADPSAKEGGLLFVALDRASGFGDNTTSRKTMAAAFAIQDTDLFSEFIRICHAECTRLTSCRGTFIQTRWKGTSDVKPGYKRVMVYRIDVNMKWDAATLELIPVENRPT